MSAGFRSIMRFGAEVPSSSPPRFCPPTPVVEPASIGLKFVVENVELFIGTPSITNSGSTSPFRVRNPRIDLGARARITGRLSDLHIRCFAGQRLDEVRLIGLRDQFGRDGIP